jgi:hypothetical protein
MRIPKKTRLYIYPESGFEARYERVLIFYDVKNACCFIPEGWLLGISAYQHQSHYTEL